jgi:hypothetical protein
MSHRKGELSRIGINHGWPHQVAVRNIAGQELGYLRPIGPLSSLCPRTLTIGDGRYVYTVYCFADPAQAESFRETLGAEMSDPADRVGGSSRWVRGSGAGRRAR